MSFFLFASSSVGDPEFLQQLREMTTFLLESDWLHKRDLAEFCVLLTHLLHFLEQAKIYVALPLIAPAPSRFEQRRRERDACLKAKKPALLARHKAQEMAGLLRDGLVMSETEAMRVIAGEYPIFLAFAGWLESKRPTFGDAPSRVADFFHQKSVDIVS